MRSDLETAQSVVSKVCAFTDIQCSALRVHSDQYTFEHQRNGFTYDEEIICQFIQLDLERCTSPQTTSTGRLVSAMSVRLKLRLTEMLRFLRKHASK